MITFSTDLVWTRLHTHMKGRSTVENSMRLGKQKYPPPPSVFVSLGTTFLYSTHAFSLLSAVVERAAGQSFLDHMAKMFRELGMLNTIPDENDPIVYRRSR